MNDGAAWGGTGTSANPVAAGADGAGAVHGTSADDTGGVGGPPNLPIPPIIELAAAAAGLAAAGPTMVLGVGGLGNTGAAAFPGGRKAVGRNGGTAGLGGGGKDAFPNGGFGQGWRPAIESHRLSTKLKTLEVVPAAKRPSQKSNRYVTRSCFCLAVAH